MLNTGDPIEKKGPPVRVVGCGGGGPPPDPHKGGCRGGEWPPLPLAPHSLWEIGNNAYRLNVGRVRSFFREIHKKRGVG